jgi:hypothetical protein
VQVDARLYPWLALSVDGLTGKGCFISQAYHNDKPGLLTLLWYVVLLMGTGYHHRALKVHAAGPTEWWNVCIYLSMSIIVCNLYECSLCISNLLAFSIDTLAPVNNATWKGNLCLIKHRAMITSALAGVQLSSSHPSHISPKERAAIKHWIGGLVVYRTGLDALGMRKTCTLCEDKVWSLPVP